MIIFIHLKIKTMEKKTVQKIPVLSYSLNTTLQNMHTDTGNLPNELIEKAQALQLEVTGPQIWAYDGADGNPSTPFELTIALPVQKFGGNPGKFSYGEFPEMDCISEMHYGPWNQLGTTYHKLMPAIMKKGYTYSGISREVYHVCDFENQENCVTEVQIEIK